MTLIRILIKKTKGCYKKNQKLLPLIDKIRVGL